MRTLRFAALLLALVSPAALAFENEPTGFRGIGWAVELDAVRDQFVVLKEDTDRTFMQRKGEKLNIGEAELESVTYIFYKGRFSGSMVRTAEGIQHQRALRDAMTAQFGKPHQPNRYIERWYWFGPTAMLSLNCAHKKHCLATFSSKAMTAEERRDREAAAGAAKKDF